MSEIRADDLARALARGVAPLYVVHGDEPLFVIEAADQVRIAARAAGCSERETLVVEPGFKWDAFLASQNNLGLFGGRTLVDLRMPTGKPGVEGARVLEAFAQRLPPDNVTLVTMPRADRATQGSAWFSALAAAGVVVPVYPLEREALPRWIAARFERQHQRVARETAEWLAQLFEGNLLAAHQEIEKLALLLPHGTLAHDAVEAAVSDVARYDVFALSDAWLAGDPARTLRVLMQLRAAGEPLTLAVWQLSEDVQALAALQAARAAGTPVASAVRAARIWGRRASALERSVPRVPASDVAALLRELATLDGLAKGIGRGDAWTAFTDAALRLAGRPRARGARAA
ncbi:MAG: DNA polymerase III subunit delta [Proteobacteria bacterium]|nr:DNA polymerase III subunit delta [Pseudomonadota bacterium]